MDIDRLCCCRSCQMSRSDGIRRLQERERESEYRYERQMSSCRYRYISLAESLIEMAALQSLLQSPPTNTKKKYKKNKMAAIARATWIFLLLFTLEVFHFPFARAILSLSLHVYEPWKYALTDNRGRESERERPHRGYIPPLPTPLCALAKLSARCCHVKWQPHLPRG